MTTDQVSIARIVRVNHAGEFGAIRIYGAQVLVSSVLWSTLVKPLQQLRDHEIEHCRLFRSAMPERNSRPCRTMWLWSCGGWVLGILTALLGPRAIWTCTEIVEETVHRHLGDQLDFLKGKDAELHELIECIREEEEGHLELALAEKGHGTKLTRFLETPIAWSVEAVIWLSTWGDSARMRREFTEALQ